MRDPAEAAARAPARRAPPPASAGRPRRARTPVEELTPEQITERHRGRVHGVVGPWNGDAWRT
ncbi:hypothetical protein, partial [Streptomyces sp. NPDC003483]